MDPWTPDMRNDFINEAITSGDSHGYRQGYTYKVFPKQDKGQYNDDPRRIAITEILAETIYDVKFKNLAMSFYRLLCEKLATSMIGHLFNRDFVVLLKGSNAHVMLNGGIDDIFQISDTDIVVCINPFLEKTVFANIKTQVEITVRQALSQYKRTLDHVLFLNKHFDNDIITPAAAAEFKKVFDENLATVDVENAVLMSPFMGNTERNSCSRNSFLITSSKTHENSVVRIEVPHFDRCERIPLRKTPLFCSFNETIDFNRDGKEKKGKFNLYRLKMNVLCCHTDADGKITREEKIPADFIDVSVPDQQDIELMYFWRHGRSINIYDYDCGIWITIPDLETCIEEFTRILEEYDSCDIKKGKRMLKLAKFKMLMH